MGRSVLRNSFICCSLNGGSSQTWPKFEHNRCGLNLSLFGVVVSDMKVKACYTRESTRISVSRNGLYQLVCKQNERIVEDNFNLYLLLGSTFPNIHLDAK